MDNQVVKSSISETLDSISCLVKDIDLELVIKAAEIVAKAIGNGKKLILCGNGGSAADAQHIAGEFVGRFLKERRPMPAIALNTNVSVITAIGNDYGFDELFARQVDALGFDGDVLLAISTSGKSANIITAINRAKGKGMIVIGLTGKDGGYMKDSCDICIRVPSSITPRIQEMHIIVGHILSELVEGSLT